MNTYSVDIVVSDGNGQILCSQPFDEFRYGTKSIEIQKVMYGKELLDLLVDELNVIRYSENGKLILGVILQSDINRTAMSPDFEKFIRNRHTAEHTTAATVAMPATSL